MLPTTRRVGAIARQRDLHLVRGSLDPALLNAETRSLHTSSPSLYESSSYNGTSVPEFFSKYKEQRPVSPPDSGAQHEELGLMQSLTDSIRTGDVVTRTRRLRSKVPMEHRIPEGHTVHPSGFVCPGPGHTSTSDVARAKERERNERLDSAIQTAAVAHRVLESGFEQVAATTLPNSSKIPFEVREPDGSIKHPSGFEPPTPAHEFRHFVRTNVCWDSKVPVPRRILRQPSPGRTPLRAVHTTSKTS